MECVSRDTYQDRFVNFTTDTDRAPIINNYLTSKIKVTPFCNAIGRTDDALSKHRYSSEFTNTNKFEKLCSNGITDGTVYSCHVTYAF